MTTIGSPLLWLAFVAFILVMLTLDLGVFHKNPHEVSLREALVWTIVWISLAGVFGVGVYFMFGGPKAMEFAAGFILEKALSVDNIFVFVVIFASFAVPPPFQHRVLFWGVLGALVLRGIFILLGASLLQRFHWLMYGFGVLLLWTAFKLLMHDDEPSDPKSNRVLVWFRRIVPSVPDYHGAKFWVVQNGRRMATPLLAVLVLVELSDVLFAVDSIPAIFAVTQDPFIVFTSNIFAILGLRSLYFLLAGAMHRFQYLKPGLAVVLAFVGVKMLLIDLYKIPIALSLGVIAAVMTIAVVASLLRTQGDPKEST